MGSERGEQPLSCNDDDRCLRQKQGGVVGAVASRMQGPLKGRSIRWEPQPVQGRGVSRGREGGVETPLSPSGPAERPRRRCILQKASDLPYATALCAGKDDLELPPLCSGNRSGRIIFYSRLSRSAERSKRIFTGGAVPGSCICCCWPAVNAQREWVLLRESEPSQSRLTPRQLSRRASFLAVRKSWPPRDKAPPSGELARSKATRLRGFGFSPQISGQSTAFCV